MMTPIGRWLGLALLCLLVLVTGQVAADARADADAAYVKGNQYMTVKDYNGALREFNKAINAGGANQNAYYKRGLVHVILNRPLKAIADFTVVLSLTPDDTSALRYRGEQYAKEGRLDDAVADYEALSRATGAAADAELLAAAEKAKADLAKVTAGSITANTALELLNTIIDVAPRNYTLRRYRARAYQVLGRVELAIGDYQRAASLGTNDGAIYVEIADLQYSSGDVKAAVKTISECLKIDPEHKKCLPRYKEVKKVSREILSAEKKLAGGDLDGALSSYAKALKLEKTVKVIVADLQLSRCKIHFDKTNHENAVTDCTSALNAVPGLVDALLMRAKAYLELDKFDEAIRDYQTILGDDEDNQQAREGMEVAQKRKKMAGKRDYYKILGVPRNADKKQIKKAYRESVKKYHPDSVKTSTPEEKAEAEKRFRNINDAKEVLEDAEKRAMFDRGEDPLDPEEQQGQRGGGHPFGHGHPFGGFGGFGNFGGGFGGHHRGGRGHFRGEF